MLGNYPIIFVSGSHYCIKKGRRRNSSPDHKHSNLSSREIALEVNCLPPHFELPHSALWLQIPSIHLIHPSLRNVVTRRRIGQPKNLGSITDTRTDLYLRESIKHRQKNGRDTKPATDHHLRPRLRMDGTIPLLPHAVAITYKTPAPNQTRVLVFSAPVI
jgi:hypothetical protein